VFGGRGGVGVDGRGVSGRVGVAGGGVVGRTGKRGGVGPEVTFGRGVDNEGSNVGLLSAAYILSLGFGFLRDDIIFP
jgi:hypothetical protein